MASGIASSAATRVENSDVSVTITGSPPDSACKGIDAASPDAEQKVLSSQLLDGGELVEELVCKICLDVVGNGPKLAKCSHLFCGDCLAKWFVTQRGNQSWAEKAKSGGAVPCPICRERLHETRDVYPVCENGQHMSAFLWGMLMRTKIRCANHPEIRPDGACDWTGEYGAYQTHIRSCQNVALSRESSHSQELSDADVVDNDTDRRSEISDQPKTEASTVSSEQGRAGEGADGMSSSANESDSDDHDQADADAEQTSATDPDLANLLGSIGALLELKLKAKEREMAEEKVDASDKEETLLPVEDKPVSSDEGEDAAKSPSEVPDQKPEQPVREKKQPQQPKKTKAGQEAADVAAFRQQQRKLQQAEHQLLAKAAHLNQYAQWQRAQAAHMAYAAHVQAAHWNAAYASQWHQVNGAAGAYQSWDGWNQY